MSTPINFNLPYKPHFAITCSCGKCFATELTPEQLKIAQTDSVAALHCLSPENQAAAVAFYVEHHKMGHAVEPALIELAPMPQA